MCGIVRTSDTVKPRCVSQNATVSSGFGVFNTTWDELDWNGWTAVGFAHRGGDVARHLDGAALVVEEPKPVPAARRVQFGRLCHDLHTTQAQCCGESINHTSIAGTERYDIDALCLGLAQPQHVGLWRAGCGGVSQPPRRRQRR